MRNLVRYAVAATILALAFPAYTMDLGPGDDWQGDDSIVKPEEEEIDAFLKPYLKAHAAEVVAGTVNRVVDGDTLHAVVDGKKIIVRMAGIDAPESKQPYGAKATAALSSLTLGKECVINIQDTDTYGRKVAFVTCGSNVSANEVMAAQGNAWAYMQYLNKCEGAYERVCFAAIKAAYNKLGLWALPESDRIAPWEWRKGH